MYFFVSTAAVALAASSLVLAAPTTPNDGRAPIQLPLANGFPHLSFISPGTKELEKEAFGTLSNAAPPPRGALKPDTLTSLRLVAFNELFESAYFANFVHALDDQNFLSTLPSCVSAQFAKDTIKSILAVEQLHALNANGALVNVGGVDFIKPCVYKFPMTDFKSAISLANRFTDVVLGTLQDVVFHAASNGDAGLAPAVASTIGDEAQQDGWFRTLLSERPNAQPFLTRSVRDYAFSLLQDFVVPGSCPAQNQIDLTVFQPLVASADPPVANTDLEFSFSLRPARAVPPGSKTVATEAFASTYGTGTFQALSIAYLNGQNKPVTVPLKSLTITGLDVKVTAAFPQQDYLMYGLTLAALTVGGNFASAQEMVDATLFGPAPLETREDASAQSGGSYC